MAGRGTETLDHATTETDMNNTNSVVVSRSFLFNITMIQSLIRALDTQLQYATPQPSIQVAPVVSGSLTVSGQTADLRFPAPLNVTMSNGLISFNGTDYTQNGNFTSTVDVSDAHNVQLRNESFAFFFISLVAVSASGGYTTVSIRRKKPASGVEKLDVRHALTGRSSPRQKVRRKAGSR